LRMSSVWSLERVPVRSCWVRDCGAGELRALGVERKRGRENEGVAALCLRLNETLQGRH
jgi:hypothetical protein